MCLGLDATIEGEQGDTSNEYASGDKPHLNLPGLQEKLLETVYKVGKPVILVLLSGSALAVTWADEHIPAIIQAWYPGAEGGEAIASLIFGDYSPSARLPVTFYRSTEELPDFGDYSMKNRTYRYMTGEALYPFGYGLSYTKFEYRNMEIGKFNPSVKGTKVIPVSLIVQNTGKYAGEETVQLYLRDMVSQPLRPVKELKDFKKILLQPGEIRRITFNIKRDELAFYNDQLEHITQPGTFQVMIGSASDDIRLQKNFELTN